MMLTTGCNATWIGQAQSIIATVVQIVNSILAAISLFGVKISPTVTQDITTATADITNELNVVGAGITEYEANPSPTLLSAILNGLTVAQENLTALLTNIQITNVAIQTKIGDIITLAINTVKELIVLIPSPTATMSELHAHYTRIKDYFNSAPEKKIKSAYNAILSAPTGDSAIDAVFAQLPKL